MNLENKGASSDSRGNAAPKAEKVRVYHNESVRSAERGKGKKIPESSPVTVIR